MNKTLYVRNEDAKLWEQAREYTGDRLSAWISEQIRIFVRSKEAAARGMQRIELRYTGAGAKARAKAFTGRWLIAPDVPYVRQENGTLTGYALALTAKDNVAVFRFSGEKSSETGHYPDGEFKVFRDFAEAGKTCPERFIAKAMERAGIEAEELDI